MSGLAVVRTARLNMVVGADRNIQRLLEIPIEIADQNAIGAIWIRKPSLERARKAGARIMRWLHWQLLAPGLSARCEQQRKRRACQYPLSYLHKKIPSQKNKEGIALYGQPLPRLRDSCCVASRTRYRRGSPPSPCPCLCFAAHSVSSSSLI